MLRSKLKTNCNKNKSTKNLNNYKDERNFKSTYLKILKEAIFTI